MRPGKSSARVGSRASTCALSVLLLGTPLGATGQSVTPPAVEVHLTRGDLAFDDRLYDVAEQEYREVLARDPGHARALFRLAQMHQDRPFEAIDLLSRYLAVAAGDPWGYLALGDALVRAGDAPRALRAYKEAYWRAPDEREIVLALARMLAHVGRVEAAIAEYERWLRRERDDAEAWLELGYQRGAAGRWNAAAEAFSRVLDLQPEDQAAERALERAERRTAPAVELGVGGVQDSDVSRGGGSVAFDFVPADRWRLGVAFSRVGVSDVGGHADSTYVRATARAALRSDLRVVLSGGATGSGVGSASRRPVADLDARLRWHPSGGATTDIRLVHGPVESNTALARNRVMRDELAVRGEVPTRGPLKLRGAVRQTWLQAIAEQNHRSSYSGAIAWRIATGANVSGQLHRVRHARPARTGYFAPARIDVLEAGVDLERGIGPLSLSLDAAGGMQRVRDHGAEFGGWGAVVRAWSLVAWPVARGREVRLETEMYEAHLAQRLTDVPSWRSVSATATLRVTLR